ncbi:hypothetical protein FRC10_010265 [Ceratobasidium sp. 414]|nr:hypothetical protein FRC10_010265 [Ceratobasidium sp. 414]
MVDLQTLAALHRHWKLYAEFASLPSARVNKLRREHSQLSKRFATMQANNVGVGRSAGILWHEAMTPMAKLFQKYWETGTTFTSSDDIQAATELNPTFVYAMAGETFNPHYGTFPQGFHFAPAFAPVTSDPTGPAASGDNKIMDVAKRQFTAWCQAFRTSLLANAITIRFFSGEATALCRALEVFSKTNQGETGIFACQWHGSELNLGDCMPMPLSFDVIDTSNLLDHLGALNVLVVTQPLLKRQSASQSVLYTEALLPTGKDATQSFLDRTCADVPTIAMLLGLAPRAYLSAFTTQSNAHEIIMSSAFKEMAQFHERVAWVDPASGDPNSHLNNAIVSFDAQDLAKVLSGVYVKMFKDEYMAQDLMLNPSIAAAKELSEAHYHRESFVLLLRLVRSRVRLAKGNWDQTINQFLGYVTKNKDNILEMNHYQDLCLQLHLYGLFSVSSLQPNWRLMPRVGNANYKIFDGWDDIPPVVCLVLVVPRKNLGILMNESAGSPRFQVNILGGSSYHNNYSSLQGVWGACVSDPNDSSKILLEEDPMGVHGTSDLIVSVWAAPYLLVTTNTTVCFALRLNPFSIVQFRSKLGVNLDLFSTELENKKHVHILRDRPMANSAVQRTPQLALGLAPPLPELGTISQVGIKKEEKAKFTFNAVSLTARLDIDSPDEQAELLGGVTVSANQFSPAVMEVSVGESRHLVPFPYPILGASNRLRIARKSHYVEVIVNFANPLGSGGYALNAFPIIRHGPYSPWNVHHIHLDRMPVLDVKAKNKVDWVKTQCVFQVSDRERAVSEIAKSKPENVMINVKESIYAMFTHYVGLEGGPTRAFALHDSSGKLGVYTVVLVAGIRLDLASSTVVLDAAVVPLTVAKMPALMPGIQTLHSRGKEFEQLRTEGAEVAAWKRLLPAFVERCRTWSHTPNCEYLPENIIPLSLETASSPICSCGQGVGFTSPVWDVAWWKGLLPHATRVAISPLFAVSYLERVAGQLAGILSSRPSTQSKPASSEKPITACWSCDGPGRPNLSTCSRCKKARYCSPECQHKDWKDRHKKVCQAN